MRAKEWMYEQGLPPSESDSKMLKAYAAHVNQELADALIQFVDWHGGCHEKDCPLDDTCDCKGKPINAAVNAAINKYKNGGKQ